jgi:Fe-S cluster biogenesis protein NfuA
MEHPDAVEADKVEAAVQSLGQPSKSSAAVPQGTSPNPDVAFIAEEDIVPTEHDDMIKQLLEEYVRPAVEQDGGAIDFKAFKDGTVYVHLRGACAGCPSSTQTLKGGIEQLLKSKMDVVEEVVAAGV